MEWLFIAIGIGLFCLFGWYLHRRFGEEPPQVHSNVKPLITHEGDSLVAQGLEGKSVGN